MTHIVYRNRDQIDVGDLSSSSRLSSISDSGGTLESYGYLGLGTVVQRSQGNGVSISYAADITGFQR